MSDLNLFDSFLTMCSFQGTFLLAVYQPLHKPNFRSIQSLIYFLIIWQPPTLPYRLRYSTLGRAGLNHRVRDVYGCTPCPHRHQNLFYYLSCLSALIDN